MESGACRIHQSLDARLAFGYARMIHDQAHLTENSIVALHYFVICRTGRDTSIILHFVAVLIVQLIPISDGLSFLSFF